jgi:pimeloyl-[acyl-carrier protein] methyl ester esterase
MHWILLRGLTREQAHWGDLRQRLSDAMPGHQFHAVDLPGTGVHYRERSPNTMSAIRSQVQRQVAHIPGPYGLIGLSMGGMVALDWAQQAPVGEIQQLVLINTSSGFSPPWQRMKPSALPRILRLFASRDLFHREAGILALTSNQPVAIETCRRWYRIQRQRPVGAVTAIRQLGAAARYRPNPQRPLPDALVLASDGDRIVDSRCSDTLSQRWQWSLRVHPQAGHDLALDDPYWLVARVVEYLESSE